MTAAASHAAATKTAATAASPSPATVRKGIAGDSRTRQRQSGNQGGNLMQTRILHCGIAFPFYVLDRPAPHLMAAKRMSGRVLQGI
jgi:hypothetical protein